MTAERLKKLVLEKRAQRLPRAPQTVTPHEQVTLEAVAEYVGLQLFHHAETHHADVAARPAEPPLSYEQQAGRADGRIACNACGNYTPKWPVDSRGYCSRQPSCEHASALAAKLERLLGVQRYEIDPCGERIEQISGAWVRSLDIKRALRDE